MQSSNLKSQKEQGCLENEDGLHHYGGVVAVDRSLLLRIFRNWIPNHGGIPQCKYLGNVRSGIHCNNCSFFN